MSGNFKVGEVLVGQNHVFMPHKNGMECVVVEGLHICSATNRYKKTSEVAPRYGVLWADGEVTVTKPFRLRRKQPPTGEASILNMFVVAPPKRMKEEA